MLHAHDIAPAGTWPRASAADRVVLDYDGRRRRRIAMTGERGTRFVMDLAQAAALKDGDGLVLEDGRVVEVVAKAERLAEIRAASPEDLIRIAWHLGNRHLPTQLLSDGLRIRNDHVIVEMVRGLGAAVSLVDAPFDPESGAYSHAHSHVPAHD